MEKNKDPLNDTVVDLFKKGSNALLVDIFADHPGQSGGAAEKGKYDSVLFSFPYFDNIILLQYYNKLKLKAFVIIFIIKNE